MISYIIFYLQIKNENLLFKNLRYSVDQAKEYRSFGFDLKVDR